jgi:DNA-binding transcriptional LysR family regulator
VNVELRHLRSFLVVAEERNFTKAAARLHLAQQALSAQIRQLEEELNVHLFIRTTRKVELTPAGQALGERLPGLLAALESALEDVRRFAGLGGSLTLGLLATSHLDFAPRLLRAFAATHPNIAISVRNIGFGDPSGGILSGECDVALVWEPLSSPLLARETLFTDERLAVLAADHRLAAQERVSAAELAEEPFVWVENMDPVVRDFWTLAEQRGGRPPKIGAHITGFEDLFAAVRAGLAVAASPASIVGSLPWRDLATRPVDGLPPVAVALCWRKDDANPAVQALVECARRTAQGRPAQP